jgi:hypothetical protein
MESLKLIFTAGSNNSHTLGDEASQREMAELAVAFLTQDYGIAWDQHFNPKLLSDQANYMTKRVALGGPVFDTDDDGNYMMDKNRKCTSLEREKGTHATPWVGYSNKNKQLIPLETAWVEANFDKKFECGGGGELSSKLVYLDYSFHFYNKIIRH